MSKEIFYQPTQEKILKTKMWQFLQSISEHYKITLENYQDLHQWSITYPEQFWQEIVKLGDVKFSHPPHSILSSPRNMEESTWFEGASLNFAEHLLRHRSEKPALIFRNENNLRYRVSYQELYERVSSLSQSLTLMGVQPGDRISGYLPNIPETVIAMLAATSLGAIWSSCSPDFGVEAVLDRFGQIQPKILFYCEEYQYNGKIFSLRDRIHTLLERIPSIEKVIVVPYLTKTVHCPTDQYRAYNELLATPARDISFVQSPFNHPIYILYSSGTTGTPKCIVHGAGGTLIQHLKELILHTDLTPDDTIFYYTTCGWMMWNWLISSLAVGATIVLYDGSPTYPETHILFDLIDQEKISIFGTSAKYLASVEKNRLVPKNTHDLSSLRTILSTGSPLMPPQFDFVYHQIKKELCLSSISGGSDIVSCFALGNPILPVYRGELQCIGLGLKVEILDDKGHSLLNQKGELVCTAPFPAMPIAFWNDPDHQKYHAAYFAKYPHIWAHGDYAALTSHGGLIIYGRSDATLNAGGVRIGTAEIYRQVEKLDEIIECVAVAQNWQQDTRIVLFVRLRGGLTLNEDLQNKIKKILREKASPHHVPSKIIEVPDIPRTMNGKIVELAVQNVINHLPIKNISVLANPEALEYFKDLTDLI